MKITFVTSTLTSGGAGRGYEVEMIELTNT